MGNHAAKQLLRDNASGTLGCMCAADQLLGEDWFTWEPESVWLTLEREGVGTSVDNRAQLMAGRGLIVHGRFWYDAIIFEKTCMALNNEEPMIGALSEAPVEYMAWAVYEAQQINKHYEGIELPFDYECSGYVAARLWGEGYVVAPRQLEWAQERLDPQLPPESSKLKTLVTKAWTLSPKGDALLKEKIPESMAGVQIAKLGAVDLYVERRKIQMRKDSARLEA